MKTTLSPRKPARTGSALALTMVMTGIALAILASAMTWSANSTRMTHRSVQYTRSVAAAEAATEMVLSQITRDFLSGGEKLVGDKLDTYRQTVPKPSDSAYWNNWEFNDAAGNASHNYVARGLTSNYVIFGSSYAGLRGYVSSYTVVAHARETAALQDVVAGVLQEAQLARIPVFQFAMYSSGDMEISCGQPFTITGRVHANKHLYVEPDNALTFQSYVTAVTDILFKRHPLDTRGAPAGTVVYQVPKDSPVAAMTLPIGTTNTPEAIREIIQPPPVGEDANSPLGRLRYYNQADLILVVSNSGISATSGKFNGFATPIPTSQLAEFVTTTNSFHDAREEKTIRPIDINVGVLTEWSRTNSSLRPVLPSKDVTSVYIVDRRMLAGTELGAVRVRNGLLLPGAAGLTVATARPLYVLGNYNQTNAANLGTTNTITTKPASLVADAVTILSGNWSDANSKLAVGSRTAAPTTVNAAILTGVVETTKQPAPLSGYSGGMENFPRFLETWGAANILTYNGSMVKMFPSLYATNAWGKADVYAPPKRNWAFDLNFYDANKLPPLTPSLVKVFRGQWATVAPGKNVATAVP
jgi:hypothetical protein